MSTVKNYKEQGSDKWVIGGNLEITSEGALTFEGLEMKPAQMQVASTATTVEELKTDFNQLITKLKAAGLMASK